MAWDIWRAPKAGCAMAFNVTTSSAAKKLMEPPQSPVLLLLRASADIHIRQGKVDAVATTSDVCVKEGAYYPLMVESADDNYIAVVAASGTAVLYAAVISTTMEICAESESVIVFGIWGGGQTNSTTGWVTTMYKYIFDTDTVASSTATLATTGTGVSRLAAAGDGTAARFCGGQASAVVTELDSIQKYSYSSDTISNATTMDATRANCTGNSNPTHGYVAKGSRAGVASANTTKIAWSTDTASTLGGWSNNSSSTAPNYTFGTSAKGYWAGGTNAGTWQRVQKITYATDTFANNSPVLAGARSAGAQNGFGNTTFGWMIGGTDSGGSPINTSEKYTYASETSASSTSLSTARGLGAGTGNTTKGVICSGDEPGGGQTVTTTITFTFSSEVIAAGGSVVTGTLCSAAASPLCGGLQ